MKKVKWKWYIFKLESLHQSRNPNNADVPKERRKKGEILDYWSNKMAPASRSRFYEKLSKKNQDGTIDNLSNTFNPCFYRGIHLETARRLTPISQGGYLPLNHGNVPEDEICQQEKVEEATEKSSLRYPYYHKEFHLHLWGRDTAVILTNATLFCKNDSKGFKNFIVSNVCLKKSKHLYSSKWSKLWHLVLRLWLWLVSLWLWKTFAVSFFLIKKYTVLNAKKDVTLSFLKLSDKQIPFGSFESKKMVNHWQHHTYIKEPLDADF